MEGSLLNRNDGMWRARPLLTQHHGVLRRPDHYPAEKAFAACPMTPPTISDASFFQVSLAKSLPAWVATSDSRSPTLFSFSFAFLFSSALNVALSASNAFGANTY